MMQKSIGIDIGGTHISAGIIANGKVLKLKKVDIPKSRKAFFSKLFEVIDSLLGHGIKNIGVGFPAPVVNGYIHEVQNLSFLGRTNLKSIIEKKYKKQKIKCFVENDANCFALAEQKCGSAKGKKNAVGITLGTGLGCGVIIGGKIYSGSTGSAGEISKIPYGSKVTLENTANSRFLKKISGKNPEELYWLAKKGNKKALNAWKKYGSQVGKVLAVVVNTIDPEIIVLGGKISTGYPLFKKQIMPEIKKYCFKYSSSKVRIAKSKLKNSGVMGAGLLGL